MIKKHYVPQRSNKPRKFHEQKKQILKFQFLQVHTVLLSHNLLEELQPLVSFQLIFAGDSHPHQPK